MNSKELTLAKKTINKASRLFVWVVTSEHDAMYIRAYKNDVLLKLKDIDYNKLTITGYGDYLDVYIG